MAASDTTDTSSHLSNGEQMDCLSASELDHRIQEEINRAERQGTPLCCLLVTIGNVEELSREHGGELSERALAYVGSALRRQLRDFDRIGRPSDRELLVVLPGADSPRGEAVARRVLERLRTIKIEADGKRRPLRISVGLAAWGEGVTAEDLIAQTRAAAQRAAGTDVARGTAASPPALGRP
ncbi:MAG: diguanylate cyclase [Actinobacteria bacterium]|nr:MAG: diguanylate cyclase [Actinomycetota bacterium]